MPAERVVDGWVVGPLRPPASGGVVPYHAEAAAEAGRASPALVVPFHEAAVEEGLPRTARIDVSVPEFRGKSFVRLLAWLVAARLAERPAATTWRPERRQLVRSLARSLADAGLATAAPSAAEPVVAARVEKVPDAPVPASFATELAGVRMTFEADFGVFSPAHVDPGSLWLFEVARGLGAVDSLADVGTGYGLLAIALLKSGATRSAVATETDSVAAWLAARNARANDVTVEVLLEPDPTRVQATELTVCNFPTHLDARRAAALAGGLAARAREGRVLTVVHRSLASRYRGQFERNGVRVHERPRDAYVVLDTSPV